MKKLPEFDYKRCHKEGYNTRNQCLEECYCCYQERCQKHYQGTGRLFSRYISNKKLLQVAEPPSVIQQEYPAIPQAKQPLIPTTNSPPSLSQHYSAPLLYVKSRHTKLFTKLIISHLIAHTVKIVAEFPSILATAKLLGSRSCNLHLVKTLASN